MWTVRVIFSGKKSIYGPNGPYISGRKSIQYYTGSMDRQSVYFWKKVHIWTVSQSISGRKSIYGPHGPYLKAPCCLGRLRKKCILGAGSWKNGHGNLGNQIKTNNFVKMAPQDKPICSRDLYRNSEQNPGLKVQISLIWTTQPREKLRSSFLRRNVNLKFHNMSISHYVQIMFNMILRFV